jgi:hypothetical protein
MAYSVLGDVRRRVVIAVGSTLTATVSALGGGAMTGR